jgi:hypothetical protein
MRWKFIYIQWLFAKLTDHGKIQPSYLHIKQPTKANYVVTLNGFKEQHRHTSITHEQLKQDKQLNLNMIWNNGLA